MSVICSYTDSFKQLSLDSATKYRSLSFAMASGPHQYYNIVAPYNTFTFYEGGWLTVTVPPGNYGITDLLSTTQILVNASAPANTYSLTHSTSTKIVTFTRTAGSASYAVGSTEFHVDAKVGFEQTVNDHLPAVGEHIYNIVNYSLELWVTGPNFSSCGVHEGRGTKTVLSSTWKILIPVDEIFGGAIKYEPSNSINQIMTFPRVQPSYDFEVSLRDPLNNLQLLDNNGGEIMLSFKLEPVR